MDTSTVYAPRIQIYPSASFIGKHLICNLVQIIDKAILKRHPLTNNEFHKIIQIVTLQNHYPGTLALKFHNPTEFQWQATIYMCLV